MTQRLAFLSVSLLAVASLAGCSLVSKGGSSTTSGGGGEPAGPVLGDTMADAPTYAVGDAISSPVQCHTSGYAKVQAEAGAPYQLEVAVSAPGESCVGISWLNANGGATGGLMEEVCTNESPATFDITGMEGVGFLQVAENGVCVGATITMTVK
jgi:hypothetical protein